MDGFTFSTESGYGSKAGLSGCEASTMACIPRMEISCSIFSYLKVSSEQGLRRIQGDGCAASLQAWASTPWSLVLGEG